jgi:sporulation protein YlmC with PRC-barrel domain
MRLELGKPVRCTDHELGELADLVIDPVKKRVTHLVVKSHHGIGEAHLVPIELAEAAAVGTDIRLTCSLNDARRLPNAEEFAYLRLGEVPEGDSDWDVGVTTPLALPYYESGGFDGYAGGLGQDIGMVYDRVPKGEVEVRRSSNVITSDGHYVGDVDGFLVDDADQITHFVLERGHLWGRREVTVPIGAVARVESDTVTLSLSTDEIGALPAHRVHRWPLAGAT